MVEVEAMSTDNLEENLPGDGMEESYSLTTAEVAAQVGVTERQLINHTRKNEDLDALEDLEDEWGFYLSYLVEEREWPEYAASFDYCVNIIKEGLVWHKDFPHFYVQYLDALQMVKH